jgi:hypothetical protein
MSQHRPWRNNLVESVLRISACATRDTIRSGCARERSTTPLGEVTGYSLAAGGGGGILVKVLCSALSDSIAVYR